MNAHEEQLPFCGPGNGPPCRPDWTLAALLLGIVAAYTIVLWPRRLR